MFSVAIIGGDGAGKTTIGRRLERSSPLPAKYLYMGTSLRSSNHVLPTSRLVFLLKQRAYSRRALESGAEKNESVVAHYMEYGRTDRGPIWTAFRHLNRLIEAWYRQIISLFYQLRGYVVIYDRHFLFDSATPGGDAGPHWQVHFNALNHWILTHLYPEPHLTVLLDAPADLLYARKGEATPEYLDRQRDAYLEQGKEVANFVRVDATQPLENVFDDVLRIVLEFHANDGRQALQW